MDGNVPKAPVHQLLDIWTALPGLVEDSDALLAARSANGHQADQSDEDFHWCVSLTMIRIFSWRWKWGRRFPTMAYEKQVVPTRSITVDDVGAPLFDTVIFYGHLHQSPRALTIYNLASLQLLQVASSWRISDLPAQAPGMMDVRDAPTHASPLLMRHEHLFIKDVSTEICRSIEYHLLADHNSKGTL